MLFSSAHTADSSQRNHPRARRGGATGRRAGAVLTLIIALVGLAALQPTRAHAQTHSATTAVGVKYYYLGLGDSLAFGYQPNLNFSHGYVAQWYTNLQSHGSKSQTNYGCAGEKSGTFINGGCPYQWLLHNYYAGPQLKAALAFIKAHAGKVSPVSLDMGANDLLPDINTSTCTVSASWSTDLQTLQTNMTQTILPDLVAALTDSTGHRTGDLVIMNYYDPYQNICPDSVAYVQQLNSDLQADATQFGLPIADVFTAFGGPSVPNNNICTYTWMCSSSKDIHATNTGYGVIAGAFENVTGY